jgi:hypothetical protein
MKMSRIVSLAAGTLALVSVQGSAAWADRVWSSVASGCIPYAQSINAGRYTNTGYYIAHRGANIDAINLICPITDTSIAGSDWNLEFTYLDSTDLGPGASAVAKLMSQSLSTGVTAQVVKLSSDNEPIATINFASKQFAHTFDFGANAYFIHIILDRNSAGKTVRAYSVAISEASL